MELHHIFYKGHKYPCRTLLTNDGYYITVSTEDLEKELIDENGLALNNTAMLMDNKIAFKIYDNETKDTFYVGYKDNIWCFGPMLNPYMNSTYTIKINK